MRACAGTTRRAGASALGRCGVVRVAGHRASAQAIQVHRSTTVSRGAATLARSGGAAANAGRHSVWSRRLLTADNPIARFGKRHPFLFQLIICTAKTAACDLLIQKYVERRKKIDWRRNAVFVAFGSLYLGGFQYLIYSMWFPRLFPYARAWADLPLRAKVKDMSGVATMFKQIAADLCIHNPFVYMPVFYVFKSLIKSDGAEGAEGAKASSANSQADARTAWQCTKDALSAYKRNFVEDNLAMAAVVGVGDIFTFGAPMWLRLPANHAVSFVWVCYLSWSRGGENTAAADSEEECPTQDEASEDAGLLATAALPAVAVAAASSGSS